MDWLGTPPPLRYEAHYGDRVVPYFVERPKSVYALLADAAARAPEREAYICGDTRLTWRETERRVAAIAAGLAARGARRDDRIGLFVGNRIEFVLATFAVARLGAVTVPLGVRLQGPEIAHALNDCGGKMLIFEADLADRVPGASDVPALERRIVVGGGDGTSAGEPFSALSEAGTRAGEPAEVGEEDIAFILYTSGTTGRPKGAMLTHLSTVHSSMVYEHCMGLTGEDRSVAAVPLSHVTGLVANVTALARVGATLIVMPTFKAADFIALAARERMTHTILVPAMYNLCLMQPDFERADLSAWRVGGYGGAPMPIPTIERLAEKLPGLNLVNAYGATETTSPATMLPPRYAKSHIDSVGHPVPGAAIIAVDDDGREVPRGEVGELWIGGPQVAKGYWNNLAATADNFTGGFWHSGDLGSIDADGFVRVFDRKKDMINRGGFKIYSAEVESVLQGHEDVVEAAVIGRPCPVLGERVHAFVVPNRPGVNAEDLRAWCAARLSDYKVPETITLRAEPLPRNANGKVIKRALREAV